MIYKIAILEMLSKAVEPLSNSQITDFFLDWQYTDYFNVQQVINELESSGLLTSETLHNSTRYHLTEDGKHTLLLLRDKLTDAMEADIQTYLEEHKIQFQKENALSATYDKATGMATFSWEAATDDVTPQAALQYNLYLKKAGTDGYFMTVPADLQTGFVKVGEISGQITTTTYSMHVDDADATYEWGVQAIDNGKKGGAFALSSFVPSASHIAATKLDGFEAHAEKGQIRYRAEAGTTLVITDAAGVELARFQADGEGTFGGLVHGIYMISATKGSRSATLKVAL